jgi:hypothetical protein
MPVVARPDRPSKPAFIVGWVLTAVPGVFLFADAVTKLMQLPAVVAATTRLGYPKDVIVPIGVVLLTCTILYLLTRTAVFGAILLTGYLGGAVATHVHTDRGAFEVFFPDAQGVLLWLGLYLREPRLRVLVPLRMWAAGPDSPPFTPAEPSA